VFCGREVLVNGVWLTPSQLLWNQPEDLTQQFGRWKTTT